MARSRVFSACSASSKLKTMSIRMPSGRLAIKVPKTGWGGASGSAPGTGLRTWAAVGGGDEASLLAMVKDFYSDL